MEYYVSLQGNDGWSGTLAAPMVDGTDGPFATLERARDAIRELKGDKGLLGRVVDGHQDRLKERGDWVIYPLTIQMIAEGRFALDCKRKVYLDGELTFSGLRL